ncbi:MAG: fumarylacetoacetate hydrolase family protein [Rhodospirillales bacterium]|nr:fumarylacetoacetate hydrolase family protein [Rhodospirillales bacterium]
MKLATLKEGGRDGTLVVVSRDLTRCVKAPRIAATLRAALDDWRRKSGELSLVAELLEKGIDSINDAPVQPFDPAACMAPLPRAAQWIDGSAYLNHVELVRKARKAEMPPEFYSDPLMYQGGSDAMIGPRDDVEAVDEAHGIDFEAEVAVIVDDVPMGTDPAAARGHIQLVVLVNDVSLRNLIPAELAKGFGFFQSKPSSSFSPVAVTLDELGPAWDGGKLHLPLVAELNGKPFGRPNAGTDMNFDFGQLVAHAARTRPLTAGTIVGSGTVSNKDPAAGSCCLAEVRMIETIAEGKPRTPFMRFGDRIRIEMFDAAGRSVFGAIDQKIVKYAGRGK